MADALEAGYDLGAVALCFVAIALLLAAKGVVTAVSRAIDFSFLGVRPLHFVATDLENGVVGALDDAIKGVEKAAAKFLSGLIDSLGMLIAVPLLLALGVKAALEYLWHAAIRPLIDSVIGDYHALSAKATSLVDAVSRDIAAKLDAAESFATDAATAAYSNAVAYIDTRIADAKTALRSDIASAKSAAERYADEAVSKLRTAEDDAIRNAVNLAGAAKTAGETAASAALTTAETDIGVAETAAEVAAAAALASSDAAGKAALELVRSVAVTAEHDIETVLGDLDALKVAALIAAIPAIATLVNAIATDTGLDNAECRSKVKGICGTSSSGWANLIGGLAAVGFAFNLRELNKVARPLIGGLADVLKEAA